MSHAREEGFGARAWKGFDWDTLNRLHAKGYISDPIVKAKSVAMSEEGFLKAKELCERHFSRKAAVISLPQFTVNARSRWDLIPESDRKMILDNVFCSHCGAEVSMQLKKVKMSGRSLVLRGDCKKCGGEVARVVEPAEG